MKKRFLSVAAGVLAVSAMLAGCGGSGATKNESSADNQSSARQVRVRPIHRQQAVMHSDLSTVRLRLTSS